MKKIYLGLAAVALTVVLAGCGMQNANQQTSSQQNGNEPIKIGFLGPLTGDVATVGQNNKAATELAVDAINNSGGINGRQIQMIWEDGKCDGQEAANAASKLVNIDKVTAIIGGGCSAETLAAAPIAEQGKVIMFSPLSSNPSITAAGDYIFRDYPSDSYQGAKAAEFAMNELQGKNIAVLSCMSDWCTGVAKVFKDKVNSSGGKIIDSETFTDNQANDLRTQLTKIKNAKADVIYFLAYSDATINGLKQIKQLGIKAKLLGGDSWDDPKIAKGAGTAAEGTIYFKPSAKMTDAFKAAMAAKTGNNEVDTGSPQAYDAVNILAGIMKNVGTDTAKIKDALYQVKDYNGVSGVITLDSNGDLATANYDINMIKDGKAVPFVK